MAVSVLDPSVLVGLIFALFFLPMVLEAYVFGKNLKKEGLGIFFEYLFLSYIVTVLAECWEWYSMCYGACTLNNFKMITKLCLDIGIVILYIVGIIGLFVKMGFYVKTWVSGANMFVLLLSIFWKITYCLCGARREVETPQKSTSRELENGNIGSNRDENESDGREIDTENAGKIINGNSVSNIFPEGAFSEANAKETPGSERDLEAQVTMENYQSPWARIYKWLIILDDRFGVELGRNFQ